MLLVMEQVQLPRGELPQPSMSQAVKANRTGPAAAARCPSPAVRHHIQPGQQDMPGPAEPSGLCQPAPCLPRCLECPPLDMGSGGHA